MLRVTDTEPPVLLAQTVYVIGVNCTTVGVPQIVPLLEPNERPVGRLGDISQLVIAPLTVAVFGVMA